MCILLYPGAWAFLHEKLLRYGNDCRKYAQNQPTFKDLEYFAKTVEIGLQFFITESSRISLFLYWAEKWNISTNSFTHRYSLGTNFRFISLCWKPYASIFSGKDIIINSLFGRFIHFEFRLLNFFNWLNIYVWILNNSGFSFQNIIEIADPIYSSFIIIFDYLIRNCTTILIYF